MIKDDYCNFKTAKLLKEKGFNWEVHRSYLVNDNCFAPADINDLPNRKDAIRIPTLQMAMKWLREEKKLNCIIDVSFNQSRNGETEYYFSVWENKPPYKLLRESSQTFSIYEKAAEAAVLYCLQNLI